MPYKDREKQLEAQKRSSKNRQERNLQFINNYKSRQGCFFCCESVALFLDLHHVNEKKIFG